MAKKLNLTMQYPDGYLESKQAAAAASPSLNGSTKGKSRKRKSS